MLHKIRSAEVIRLISTRTISYRDSLQQFFIAVLWVIYCITVSAVFSINSSLTKFCASQVVFPACTFLNFAVAFVLTSDSSTIACGKAGTFAVISKYVSMAMSMIALFQWVKRTLPHHSCLAPHSSLYTDTLNVFLKGSKCRRQFAAFHQMFAKQTSI